MVIIMITNTIIIITNTIISIVIFIKIITFNQL